jgi:hypothetical protein
VESEFINVTLTNIRSSVEWAIHNSNSGKIGRMPTATRAGIGALATALQWSEILSKRPAIMATVQLGPWRVDFEGRYALYQLLSIRSSMHAVKHSYKYDFIIIEI